MSRRRNVHLGGLQGLLVLLLLACAPVVQAQGPSAVVPGERMSDWLLRNTSPGEDVLALQWRAASERAAQEALRNAVLQSLAVRKTETAKPLPGVTAPGTNPASPDLAQRLRAMPLTGRVTLASADARWLQGVPAQDPVLQAGHTVLLSARPRAVAVLSDDGRLCAVAHGTDLAVQDYLQACLGSQADAVDWVWLVQADGRVQRVGAAPWNQTARAWPGPGAWLWAPVRGSGISQATSDNLARFLATQLPAEALYPDMPLQAVMQAPLQLAMLPALLPQPAWAQARDAEVTASDWGEIGLLQTPSARMAPAGTVRMQVSGIHPYTRATFMLQPLDWLEAGFRYTDIANRLYGPDIAGSQTYKDKSIDLKLRLREETALGPQLAVGLRDLGGTGLFSGEYVVANKRWGNWDASLGLGWGYLGARGNVRAPLGFLGEAYRTRPAADTVNVGQANAQSYFHGDAAFFGGVQWHSPFERWLFKAELDGNNYQNEPQINIQATTSPLNFGLVYRYSPNVDLSAGWERGNRLMLGLTLHTGLDKFDAPKLLDPVLPRVSPQPAAQRPQSGWGGTANDLTLYTGWKVLEIAEQQAALTLRAESDDALILQERVERAVALLHRDAPATVRRFVLQLEARGIALSRIEVDRTEWVARQTQARPPSLRLPVQQVFAPSAPQLSEPQAATPSALPAAPRPAEPGAYRAAESSFSAEWGPSYNQVIGGPDGFWLYQLGVQATLEQRFAPNTWLTGTVDARLTDNYDSFVFDGPSNLPRVRTDVRKYVTTSRLNLPLLQLTHVQALGSNQFVSAYGGMLESMYGGVGAEWLYRPWKSPFAFGVDVNRVQQRNFEQDLGFRDYRVTTGHATLYWDTGWNDVQVKLMAGRYLAGDTGATLDVRRVFANGVSMGAWATKTNVSAEQFGEGSFDKGIYLTIPFDLMLPRSVPGDANLVWTPLMRDGGARLGRRFALFDLTRQRDARTWSWTSKGASPLGQRFASGQDMAYVLDDKTSAPWDGLGDAATGVASQIGHVPASTWLLGGGLVLSASLLDKNVDQWARNHQGDPWDRAAALSNSVPYALALGTGALLTGVAGEEAARTARTSLMAAAFTLGGNYLTKYAVGRSRPLDEAGPGSLNGFSSPAVQSSFASNHVALAFALATPFAHQYDQPWLYALAGTSALGRVQMREHWLSDTVAGGLLGYAIGSITLQQQLGQRRGMRLSATMQSVEASWQF